MEVFIRFLTETLVLRYETFFLVSRNLTVFSRVLCKIYSMRDQRLVTIVHLREFTTKCDLFQWLYHIRVYSIYIWKVWHYIPQKRLSHCNDCYHILDGYFWVAVVKRGALSTYIKMRCGNDRGHMKVMKNFVIGV